LSNALFSAGKVEHEAVDNCHDEGRKAGQASFRKLSGQTRVVVTLGREDLHP
jgi:hypothetical protein